MAPARSYQFGRAWFYLTVALAAHVADEAFTDFLSVYNPIVLSARGRWAWFPMPTFTFGVWLTGLIALVIVLFALTPLASRGALPTRELAYPFAIIIGILNGCGHVGASMYFGRWMPGTTTAPILIGCGIWLLRSSLNPRPQPRSARVTSPSAPTRTP